MSDPRPPISATIRTTSGASYLVRLDCLPRLGDLVRLYSHLENARMPFKVVAVVHQVDDIAEGAAQSPAGRHYVLIHVEPTDDPLAQGEPSVEGEGKEGGVEGE